MDNNIIYLSPKNIEYSDNQICLRINLQKPAFQYLKERLGPASFEFIPFKDNATAYNIHSLEFVRYKEVSWLKGIRFFLGLSAFSKHTGELCHPDNSKPEIVYGLTGEVGKQFIHGDKIVLDSANGLNELLNNCGDTEMIEVVGYQKNREMLDSFFREVKIGYGFQNGWLSFVAAFRQKMEDEGIKTIVADNRTVYKDLFACLFEDYKGAVSPENLFSGAVWNKETHEKHSKEPSGSKWIRNLAVIPKIEQKTAIDEITGRLYSKLIKEWEEAYPILVKEYERMMAQRAKDTKTRDYIRV